VADQAEHQDQADQDQPVAQECVAQVAPDQAADQAEHQDQADQDQPVAQECVAQVAPDQVAEDQAEHQDQAAEHPDQVDLAHLARQQPDAAPAQGVAAEETQPVHLASKVAQLSVGQSQSAKSVRSLTNLWKPPN
jgi:hypothetical protein